MRTLAFDDHGPLLKTFQVTIFEIAVDRIFMNLTFTFLGSL